ncbi:MAG TPA: hypothetical protein VH985_15570 [Candidatus Binatia bacterium]|jgi:hypothetical protein
MKTPKFVIAAGMTASAVLFAAPTWACGLHGAPRVMSQTPYALFLQASSSESSAALQNIVEDVLTLVKAKEWSRATKSLNALVLPGYQAWFQNAFGDVQGAKLAAEYAGFAKFLASEDGAKELEGPMRNGRTRVHAELITATGDKSNFRDQIISTMKSKTPIYLVRLVNPHDSKDFFHMGYFAHVDGRFRSIGKL